MRPTFQETLNKLIQWYMNDELEHDNCTACVIGNLCGREKIWRYLFQTDSDDGDQSPSSITSFTLHIENVFTKEDLIERAIALCETTGYSIDELKRIEYAFEMASRGNSEDDYMFNGLCEVVDVLADIHSIDLSVREEAKALFVKA